MRSKKNILEEYEDQGAESLTFIEDMDVARLFIRGLKETEVGQKIVQKGLWTDDNLELILERATLLGGSEFTFTHFVAAATTLNRLGKLVAPEVEPEPEVERDKLGRPITEAQRRWQEMADWSNSPETSMKMIMERRKTDPAFAKFYSEQNVLRMNENPTDATVSAAAPVKQAKITGDLDLFVQRYNVTPRDRLRPRGGMVELSGLRPSDPVTPMRYSEFLEMQAAASIAGLI